MIGASSDRRVQAAALLAGLAIALVILLYAFSGQLGQEVVQTVIGLADLLGAALCAGLCFVLWRNFDRGEVLSRIWLYLGIGLGLWTLAELIYGITGLILQLDIPTPSPADAVWLPGFIPIFAAFWLRYKSLRVGLRPGQMAGLVVTFIVLAGLSTSFVLLPGIRGSAQGTTGDLILGVIYGIGDLLVAMAAGLTIVSLLGGELSRSWMLIAFGFLIQTVGDSMHYGGTVAGLYSGIEPMNWFTAVSDIAYWAGYVAIALGLYDQAVVQRAV